MASLCALRIAILLARRYMAQFATDQVPLLFGTQPISVLQRTRQKLYYCGQGLG